MCEFVLGWDLWCFGEVLKFFVFKFKLFKLKKKWKFKLEFEKFVVMELVELFKLKLLEIDVIFFGIFGLVECKIVVFFDGMVIYNVGCGDVFNEKF